MRDDTRLPRGAFYSDFRAISDRGGSSKLNNHFVPSRGEAITIVPTFFAQTHKRQVFVTPTPIVHAAIRLESRCDLLNFGINKPAVTQHGCTSTRN